MSTRSWRRGTGTPQEERSRVIDITRPLFGSARDEHVSTAAIRIPVLYPES